MENGEVKFCSSCGHQLESDAAFCPSCGAPINRTAAYSQNSKPSQSQEDEREKDREYLRKQIQNLENVRKGCIRNSIIGGIAGIVLVLWLGAQFQAFNILGWVSIIAAVLNLVLYFVYQGSIQQKTEELRRL